MTIMYSFGITGHRAEDDKVVLVPPFAESVSEGDVRWEKGEYHFNCRLGCLHDCLSM